MIKLHFEKVYSKIRENEPCYTAIPFAKGQLLDKSNVCILDSTKKIVPSQIKVTSNWEDGSVRWLFVRFIATLPANAETDYYFSTNSNTITQANISLDNKINSDEVVISPSTDKNILFDKIVYKDITLSSDTFDGPQLLANDIAYDYKIGNWEVLEKGNICTIMRGYGWHMHNNKNVYKFEITLTTYQQKPWFEVAYRIINTTNEPLTITSLRFNYNPNQNTNFKSTIGDSNYKTIYKVDNEGNKITKLIDAEMLKYQANEHNPEIFYGTFFCDYTGLDYGLCATIYQAHQNFPKAFSVDKDGLSAFIVPEDITKITLQPGMAREQKMLLHFHSTNTDMNELNFRSTVYQMPDKPQLNPEVFKNAGVLEDVCLLYTSEAETVSGNQ